MMLNKNILSVQQQIENSLEILLNLKLIRFYNPVNVEISNLGENVRLSWYNHSSGREVGSSAFLNIDQYLTILEGGCYHALMQDYSIMRVSFTFQNNKLISQNLLWWPCPVKVDFNDMGDSPIEIVNLFLDDIKTFRMRSPIRVDFDLNNDKSNHPKAHIHTQHPKSRMNTVNPICFNTFIKFIYNHYYPHVELDNKRFPSLVMNYAKSRQISYELEDKLVISQKI